MGEDSSDSILLKGISMKYSYLGQKLYLIIIYFSIVSLVLSKVVCVLNYFLELNK